MRMLRCLAKSPLLTTSRDVALEFDPERFIDERLHKYLTSNPFIFLPFNAGARPLVCLHALFLTALVVLRPPAMPRATICLQSDVVHAHPSPSNFRFGDAR